MAFGCFCYLDDWLLAAKSRDLLSRQLGFFLRTVQDLGFIINWGKSELTPTQRPIFLGAAIDIPRQLARSSPARVTTIVAAALLRRRQAPARVWLQFLGYLASLVRCAPGLPAAHATPAVASAQTLPPQQGLPHAASASSSGHPLALSAMVSAGISELGQPSEGAPAHCHTDHRCLPAGMGWPLPGQCGLWGLAPYGRTPTHQCTGVSSCTPLTPLLPTSCAPPVCAYAHRQCHVGGIYQQAGGHPLHTSEHGAGARGACPRRLTFPAKRI